MGRRRLAAFAAGARAEGFSPVVARILHAAGAPPGVVNYLPCSGGEVGDLLVTHPDVSLIAFTGSQEVGLRIISQAANGSIGLNTNTGVATYFPNPGFVGTDTFTFAAYDGSKNSNLATGTVAVAQGPFSLVAAAHVPPTYNAGWPVAFVPQPTMFTILV